MGVSAVIGAVLLGQSTAPLLDLATTVYQVFGNFVLVAVPLYVLVGTLMEESGESEKLFDFARSWVGQLRGGLGVATVTACAFFAAISGSSVATAATIGLVAFPSLTRGGYPPAFSGALIAAGGTLGILIPPSIAMILFGVLTEQSIGALFMAGAVPGILLAALMAIYTMIYARTATSTVRASWRERLQATRAAAWVIGLPIFVSVSIYSGFATPTEVAAIAVLYILVVGLLTGGLRPRNIMSATLRAGQTTAMIFALVAFGSALTEFFTLTGLPQAIVNKIGDLGLSALAVVSLMILLYFVLGTFLEATSMLLVTVPILYPVARSIGMNPLAFGVFVVLAVELAQITPPVGINLYTIAGIGRVPLFSMAAQVVPYVMLMIGMMYLLAFVPQIATWLPSTMH